MTIYILTIPHQRRPNLTAFDDLKAAYAAYGVDNMADLRREVRHDMSSSDVFRNADQLKEALALLNPRSHQYSAVAVLLERAIKGSV